MTTKTRLYRLLRDDEQNPLKDGITAKLPLANKTPMEHIRYGSRIYANSQWISTSRSLSTVKVLIRYKRRKRENRFKVCRVVEIDEEKLIKHKNELTSREFLKQIIEHFDLSSIFSKYSTKVKFLELLLKTSTGDILDFTDPSVMDKYIPRDKTARGYAKRYSEVLIERYIPAECCIRIIEL